MVNFSVRKVGDIYIGIWEYIYGSAIEIIIFSGKMVHYWQFHTIQHNIGWKRHG